MENYSSIEHKLENLAALIQQIKQVQPKAIMNLEEAASYLRISKSTLYKHTSTGKIGFYKPNGKVILFSVEDLNKWISSKRVPANEELEELPNDMFAGADDFFTLSTVKK